MLPPLCSVSSKIFIFCLADFRLASTSLQVQASTLLQVWGFHVIASPGTKVPESPAAGDCAVGAWQRMPVRHGACAVGDSVHDCVGDCIGDDVLGDSVGDRVCDCVVILHISNESPQIYAHTLQESKICSNSYANEGSAVSRSVNILRNQLRWRDTSIAETKRAPIPRN